MKACSFANIPREAGYKPMEKWPWQIGFLSEEREATDPIILLDASLARALEMFETPTISRYASGRHAYQHWIEQLEDDSRYHGLTSQQLFPTALGNAVIFDGLIDARGAASNYLHTFSEALNPVVPALREAAAKCAQIELTLRANRRLAPYPWELPSPENWPRDIRHAQADLLRHLAAIDGEIMLHLSEAIRVLPSE